jgi:O-acetyl-ADP-ribose deacetylase (regulator of RNase III)
MKAVVADITKQRVQGLMNAANGKGPMGAGVAGAYRRAGGTSVQDDAIRVCKAAGGFKEGDCYVSSPGDLGNNGVKAIYHAVTMEYPGSRSSLDTVGRALTAALERACADGIESIAIPGLGTGVGGLNPKSVAALMVRVARKFSGKIGITFVDIDPEFIGHVNKAIEAGDRNNEDDTGQAGSGTRRKDVGADKH